MAYSLSFIKSLLLTIAIETLVLIMLATFIDKKQHFKMLLLVFTGIFASFATLPYLWFVVPEFISNKVYYHLFSECFAWIMETFIFMGVLRLSFKRALIYSLLCNGISYSIGLLLSMILN